MKSKMRSHSGGRFRVVFHGCLGFKVDSSRELDENKVVPIGLVNFKSRQP